MSSGQGNTPRAEATASDPGDPPPGQQQLEIQLPRLEQDDVERRKVFDMGGNGGACGANLPAGQQIIHGLDVGDQVLVKPFSTENTSGVVITRYDVE